MSNILFILLSILIHIFTALLLPPLLSSLIAKVKALLSGRTGPNILQTYYDLIKLIHKKSIHSKTTTWVFFAGPLMSITISLLATMLIPFGNTMSPISFQGDIILFLYLFSMARFATIISALDTGSSFEGMGAARDIALSIFTEPTLFLGFATLIHISGDLSISKIFLTLKFSDNIGPIMLVFAGWLTVFLAENYRIPVDDPKTHLELTMIHEAMVLDHSGRLLALITYGNYIKMLAFSALLVGPLTPKGNNFLINWMSFYAAVILLTVTIGVIESTVARLRLNYINKFLIAGTLATIFAFFMT